MPITLDKLNLLNGDYITKEKTDKIDNNSVILENTINALISSIDSVYQQASGTATAIILTLPTLVNGYAKTFIASANNNGSETTINDKPLYKPATTTTPKLVSGKAYTVWYNLTNDCFFIKASAEGDALPIHVLASRTFSNSDDSEIVGTIPSKTSATYNPSTSIQTIASGQYLSEAQIINPVTGSANISHVLSGYTFASANGINLTGTMINRGAVTNTISTAGGTYTIPAGYHNGSGVITAPSLETVTSSGTVTSATQIVNGYKAISDGILYTGTATIESLGGVRCVSGTFYKNASGEQTIVLPFVPDVLLTTATLSGTYSPDMQSENYSAKAGYMVGANFANVPVHIARNKPLEPSSSVRTNPNLMYSTALSTSFYASQSYDVMKNNGRTSANISSSNVVFYSSAYGLTVDYVAIKL